MRSLPLRRRGPDGAAVFLYIVPRRITRRSPSNRTDTAIEAQVHHRSDNGVSVRATDASPSSRRRPSPPCSRMNSVRSSSSATHVVRVLAGRHVHKRVRFRLVRAAPDERHRELASARTGRARRDQHVHIRVLPVTHPVDPVDLLIMASLRRASTRIRPSSAGPPNRGVRDHWNSSRMPPDRATLAIPPNPDRPATIGRCALRPGILSGETSARRHGRNEQIREGKVVDRASAGR
jgi:hypothetical protein